MAITETRIFGNFNAFANTLINQAAQGDPTVIFAYSNRVFSAAQGDVELAEKCLQATAAVALFPSRLPKPNFLINLSAVRPQLVLHFLQFERNAPVRSARILDFTVTCSYVIDSQTRSHKITSSKHLQEEYEVPTFTMDTTTFSSSSEIVLVRYFSSTESEGRSFYWVFKNNIPRSKYMYSLNQSKLYFTSIGHVFVLDLVSGNLTSVFRLQPTDLFCQFFSPNKVYLFCQLLLRNTHLHIYILL